MLKGFRALEFILSFGTAYLLEGWLREPIGAFCQNQNYPVLVACLYLENPLFVMVLLFLILFVGLELVRIGLGNYLGRLGKRIRDWLKV